MDAAAFDLLIGIATPEPTTGCWLCLVGSDNEGWPRLKLNGRRDYVYRLVYRILVGPIPDGMDVDHRCRQRYCLNPDHLEAVTRSVNTQRIRGWGLRRARCRRGHEMTPENTLPGDNPGERRCATCRRELKRAAYARTRALKIRAEPSRSGP